jgi:hypothetical protein
MNKSKDPFLHQIALNHQHVHIKHICIKITKNQNNDIPCLKNWKKRNSLENILNQPNIILKSAEDIFTNNDKISINFAQFNYIIENFSNKAINIHPFCKASIDLHTLSYIIDQVRSKITDRSTKSKLTKLANLLFQSHPQEHNINT